MKVQINSIEALIIWFVKSLRALKAVQANKPDGKKDVLSADPFEVIASLPDYKTHMTQVRGELMRPVTIFIPRMETVLADLMADNASYETGIHNRQNKNRLRDKALRSLLQTGRYFHEGMKYRQQESGTEEGALIMSRVVVPPASTTSADEITGRMRELIEHEKTLLKKGYKPLQAPTLAILEKRYHQALHALGQAQKATLDLLQAQQQRRQSGDKGRRLVRKLYKFLEFFYSELPEEQRRTIGRALGFIFSFNKEKEQPDEPATEPDTTQPAEVPPTQTQPTETPQPKTQVQPKDTPQPKPQAQPTEVKPKAQQSKEAPQPQTENPKTTDRASDDISEHDLIDEPFGPMIFDDPDDAEEETTFEFNEDEDPIPDLDL